METYYCPKGHKCQKDADGLHCPECQEQEGMARWSCADALLKLGGSMETNGMRYKLYTVYAYPVGVAKIPDVLATSPEEAVRRAEGKIDWHRCFNGSGKPDLWDFAESFEAFTVYEPTGLDEEKMHPFLGDGQTPLHGDVTNALIRFLEIAPALYDLLDEWVRGKRGAEFYELHQQLQGLLHSVAPHLIDEEAQ